MVSPKPKLALPVRCRKNTFRIPLTSANTVLTASVPSVQQFINRGEISFHFTFNLGERLRYLLRGQLGEKLEPRFTRRKLGIK